MRARKSARAPRECERAAARARTSLGANADAAWARLAGARTPYMYVDDVTPPLTCGAVGSLTSTTASESELAPVT